MTNANMPVPFIIEPPMDEKNEYKTGEIFKFSIITIGKAIDFLPFFIYSFEKLGEIGFGKNKGKYEIISIVCKNSNKVIYMDNRLNIKNAIVKSFEYNEENIELLNMEFMSPFRVIKEGKFISDIDFEIVMRNLLRRIHMMFYFHCEKEMNFDYSDLIEKSKSIKMKSRSFKCFNWQRKSRVTKKTIYMNGFMGAITFEGDLKEFLPFIKLGEILHIGKGCSLGLGKYKISVM